MRRRISSVWTFFYKRIFPLFWISLWGLGAAGLWLGWFSEPAPPPPEMKWVALLAWISGGSFLIWFSRRLRSVWLAGDHLIVSDYRHEQSVPLSAIEDVTETRFWNPKMIRIHLRHSARHGDEIVFLAPSALFQLPFSDHRVVKELRARSFQAKTGAPAR